MLPNEIEVLADRTGTAETMSDKDIQHFDDVLAWRTTVREAAIAEGPKLLALPDGELREAIRQVRPDQLAGVLGYMLQAAREEQERDAWRALAITSAVIGALDLVEVPAGAETFRQLLEAQAWKEHANALHVAGDLNAARVAAQRGIGALGGNPAYAMEQADLEMVEAYIQHKQGDSETALRRVRACTTAYLARGNLRRVVRARTTEAALFYELRLFPEAETVWRSAYDDADRLGDIETRTRITHNLGLCALERGEYAAAISHFTTALIKFDELGMDTERQRALWGIAGVHAKNGRVGDAVAELNGVQADFLRRGMPLEAALVSLATIELLVTIDRVTLFPAVYEGLVATFANAGMTENALKALAYLESHASDHTVTVAEVQRVRMFMRGLRENPMLMFAA
jgi:tetratricopeptide (TPR) repeat protein